MRTLTTALCGVSLLVSPMGAAQEIAPKAAARTGSFFQEYGNHWQVVDNPFTGFPTFVYGHRINATGPINNEQDWEIVGRRLLAKHPDLFGIDSTTLEHIETKRLPLQGTTPKRVVRWRQVVHDLPVFAGELSMLFLETGEIVALDCTLPPRAETINPEPDVTPEQALELASVAFFDQLGQPASQLDSMDLTIVSPQPYFPLTSPVWTRDLTLAYEVRLSAPERVDERGAPLAGRIFVSAHGSGQILHWENLVLACQQGVRGQVQGAVNVGEQPNDVNNQEIVSLANVRLRDAATGEILARTDEKGEFLISDRFGSTRNASAARDLVCQLEGPYFKVLNDSGSEAEIKFRADVFDGGLARFNPNHEEWETAEVACAYWIDEFRNYVLAIDPTDEHLDFPVLAIANGTSGTCNAFWTGTSILMLRGGACPNMSYRSVIHHEEGHWANHLYNGDMTPSMHEGCADAWADYFGNTPCMGQDFLGPGSGCLRHGEQTLINKCPVDCDESCNGGESHSKGKVIASALWKTRRNLTGTLGDDLGRQVADGLFLSWFQAFDDSAICNVILDHWIALDDDNGSLVDGTPHFAEIHGGFLEQEFPPLHVEDVDIELLEAPSLNASLGPWQPAKVVVRLDPWSESVPAAELRYSLDGGQNFAAVPLMATAEPMLYEAQIPGQGPATTVSWYVWAVGAYGHESTAPSIAPQELQSYHHGTVTTVAQFDFEADNDEGWTQFAIADGTLLKEWQRGAPGQITALTDPTAAYSGTQVWGTNLALEGGDGKYALNLIATLNSPSLAVPDASRVLVQYRRWLSCDRASLDRCRLLANNQVVWENPDELTIDRAWHLQQFDVTDQLQGGNTLDLTFELLSDGDQSFGGMHIDDVTILTVDPTDAGDFLAFGSACSTSGQGAPNLIGSGVPTPCGEVQLQLQQGLPNQRGFLFYSGAEDRALIKGGPCEFLLAGPLPVPFEIRLDAQGAGDFGGTVYLPPGTQVFWQYMGYDLVTQDWMLSNGLEMNVR